MNTTAQPQPRGSRGSKGGRAGALDVVLLILAILALTGAAAGIVIGFPQALDIVAAQASAATVVAADTTEPEHHAPAANEVEDEAKEPFVADDIRREDVRYAGAAAAGPSEPRECGRRRG